MNIEKVAITKPLALQDRGPKTPFSVRYCVVVDETIVEEPEFVLAKQEVGNTTVTKLGRFTSFSGAQGAADSDLGREISESSWSEWHPPKGHRQSTTRQGSAASICRQPHHDGGDVKQGPPKGSI
jgi:hypothetical protein